MIDYYKILSLQQTANISEIKASFKQLAIKYHPDKNPNDRSAEEKFKEINEAYQVLSDPNKKATYDFLLTYGFQPQQETNTQNRHRPRAQYKGEKIRPEPRKVKLLYLYIFSGFAAFITFGFYFFSFMENQAANGMLKKAELLYYKEGKPYEALKQLSAALTKNDEFSEAYFQTGKIVFKEIGNFTESLYYLDQAIYTAKGTEDSLGHYYFWRGKANKALTYSDKALSDFKSAFTYLPENSELQLELAEIYLYKFRKFDEAIIYFDMLLNENSKNYQALVGKGISLQKKLEYEKSFTYLESAKNLQYGNGDALFYLGWYELNYKKDTIQACDYWQNAGQKGVKETENLIKEYCLSSF